MITREELQTIFENLLESKNVYYQPPETLKISYPAIIYTKSTITKTHADNKGYRINTRYNIIVVSQRPDHPVIQKLLELPYCSYDRRYISDNLYHDSLNLYT